MEYIVNYIRPELAVLIPVLAFIGEAIKKQFSVKKSLPLLLMAIGVSLALIWVLSVSEFNGTNWLNVIFTAITQGIICTAGAVCGYELFKNVKK